MVRQVAVKAIIRNPAGAVLILCQNGRWHEPGGRLEADELLEDGLRREIQEETGLRNVKIGEPFYAGEWLPEIKGERVHIVAVFFLCATDETAVIVNNREHQDYAWVTLNDLHKYTLEPETKRTIEIVLGGNHDPKR